MRLTPLLAAAVLGAAPLAAQPARTVPIELGVDAAISTDDVTDATEISIPLQRLRAGFFLSPRISLEPTLAYNRASADDGSANAFDGALGLLAHVVGSPTGHIRTSSLFVRPFAGLSRLSFDIDDPDGGTNESVTQANAGVGLGVKLPVGDRLAWRLEGIYTRRFESDEFPSSNAFALTLGLSFHTR